MPEDEAAGAPCRALRRRRHQSGCAPSPAGPISMPTEAGLAVIDARPWTPSMPSTKPSRWRRLPPFTRVAPRQMLATVKIIPFAAPRACGRSAPKRARRQGRSFGSRPFVAKRVALISTALPSTNPAILDKNRAALDARLTPLGSTIVLERRVAHEADALAAAIGEARAAGCDPILVFGASAITDRRDVIPAAIEAAGGTVAPFRHAGRSRQSAAAGDRSDGADCDRPARLRPLAQAQRLRLRAVARAGRICRWDARRSPPWAWAAC